MAELNKLNLTPRPIYPEPSSSSAALPDGASPSTFDVGSGSEVASDRFELLTDEARNRMNYIADTSAPVADESRYRLHDLRERLNQKLPIWKRQARERADDARAVARHTAIQVDEKARRSPVETILAAAGVGLVLGASMRIWRSSRG